MTEIPGSRWAAGGVGVGGSYNQRKPNNVV